MLSFERLGLFFLLSYLLSPLFLLVLFNICLLVSCYFLMFNIVSVFVFVGFLNLIFSFLCLSFYFLFFVFCLMLLLT
ncbi:hypothetical protein D8X81_05865 [Helicobacter pylori]|nr:hypothetical protein D8X81_05865 [Helicobacter pylori]